MNDVSTETNGHRHGLMRFLAFATVLFLLVLLPSSNIAATGEVADVLRSDALPTPEQLRELPVVLLEKAAELIKEVKVPEGFSATIFATPPAVNYPVFLAAAPDGTLYVSSDGNGSLGRDPNRGRVLRVRDVNGDGQADEVKAFVPNIDSPRGLVWDHDRLYLLHPPHLSVFIDQDGDGRAEEQKVLVKNIAFGFKDRPADHTSNGIELGMDGWIYAAIGDFGFMEAEGTDGRKLQLRGGGVVRVRPDGTGLELFARGTRNILEVAVSPLLDGFARDNTNDGGGWDIRLHHFTGGEDHGYPRLFLNFPDEIVQPLADYGGGSGCGAVWIDEPGIPEPWNNAPFTADWGRNWAYHHPLQTRGATFEAGQKEFVSVPRVTDLDVDGQSAIYVASWKGASFNWVGNDVGYLVRLTPRTFTPEPMPVLDTMNDEALVAVLTSPSHRRRLAAQRALLRRALHAQTVTQVTAVATNQANAVSARVAALFTLQQAGRADGVGLLTAMSRDSSLAPWALRALSEYPQVESRIPVSPFLDSLKSADARTRKEAILGLGRIGDPRHGTRIAPLLTDADPIVRHTAMQVIRSWKAADACWAIWDTAASTAEERAAVTRVLQEIHEPEVVTAVMTRLQESTEGESRNLLLTMLCRLHYREGVWKGSSWGTRPDTRGPYYTPEPWSETDRIGSLLKARLEAARGGEAVFLARECIRHRVHVDAALGKLVLLADEDSSVVPTLLAQLGQVEKAPASARPLLVRLARAEDTSTDLRAGALAGLARGELDADTLEAALTAIAKLKRETQAGRAAAAVDAFLSANQLERRPELLTNAATNLKGATSLWADAAILRVLDRLKPRQEAHRQLSGALDEAWKDPKRRAQLIEASLLTGKRILETNILVAVGDSDPAVATLARQAVEKLKLNQPGGGRGGAVVATTPVDQVLRAIMRNKGSSDRGERVFTQVGCNACHTVKSDEPLKGPYLGNIANIYKRRELAEAVLFPNKTIAQGFATHRFELKDGEELDGFVTQEAAEQVTVRTVTAQEMKIRTSDIAQRRIVERSLMPEGLVAGLTVEDFASLLTFLERLAATP